MVDSPLELKNTHNDLLRVDSFGAKFEVFLGGVLVLGKFQRGDGKSGITHPCTPIFGPDRKNLYGLKQHGNMRNEVCNLVQEEQKVLVSHMIIDEGYPDGMSVKQTLGIENGVFQFSMTHTNTGSKDAAVNAGEHCYFDAPQGFEGTTINGQDITTLIKNNYDGIAVDLKDVNSINIPSKPEFILEQQGFKKAVVWVGKNPETKEIDKTYVCIEPVENDPFGEFFGSVDSFIKPAQKRSVSFTLKITSV